MTTNNELRVPAGTADRLAEALNNAPVGAVLCGRHDDGDDRYAMRQQTGVDEDGDPWHGNKQIWSTCWGTRLTGREIAEQLAREAGYRIDWRTLTMPNGVVYSIREQADDEGDSCIDPDCEYCAARADAPAPEQDATQQRLDDLAEQLRTLQQRVDRLQGAPVAHRACAKCGARFDPYSFAWTPDSTASKSWTHNCNYPEQQGGELREGEAWQARHALEALWAACGDELSRDALAAVRTELVHLWAVEQHAKEYIDKTNNSNRLALTECLDRGGVLLRGTQEPQPPAPGVK